jgi:hypothetical protein
MLNLYELSQELPLFISTMELRIIMGEDGEDLFEICAL